MAECLLLKAGGGGVDCDAATAMKSDVLAGKTFGGKDNDELQTGTMVNNGAKTASLNCGGSYTIPAGYHNGSGKVIANSLASQTSANAAAGDIIKGKTAYVNGSKVTGSLEDRASQTAAVSLEAIAEKAWVRVPFGAYRTPTASGYPLIILDSSQINIIAKARYGGVAFNGATFDGIMLSGVAQTSIFRLGTPFGECDFTWNPGGFAEFSKADGSVVGTSFHYVSSEYEACSRHRIVFFTPTVDLSLFSKIRIKAKYSSVQTDIGRPIVTQLYYMMLPYGNINKISSSKIECKSFHSGAFPMISGPLSNYVQTGDIDISALSGQHLLGIDVQTATGSGGRSSFDLTSTIQSI